MADVISREQKAVCYFPGDPSNVKTVTYGVLQSSALGLLLFLCYINHLHCAYLKSLVHYFAYGTYLSAPGKKIGTIESVINHLLKLPVQWLQRKKLSSNETKTELIIFRSLLKHLSREQDIRINNHKLKLQLYIKYLGRLIDEVLSWNKQIDNICRKQVRKNGLLSKLRHFMSFISFHVLYRCLVCSYSTQRNIDRISKLQKWCIRIITDSEFNEHTGPLFSELKLLKLRIIFD